MKILFVTHCCDMAGANRSMLQLIIELRDNYGIESFVLLPKYDGQSKTLKDKLADKHFPFIEIPIGAFKQQVNYTTRWNAFASHRQIKTIAKELRPYRFDFVHSNSSIIDFGGYLSRVLGVKHIWHLRDFGDLDYSLYSVFGKTYERLTYQNAEGFIAISDCIKNHFSKIIEPARIVTIYNGVTPVPKGLLASHNNTVVQFFCAGYYGELKNQIEILQAVNVLVNEFQITDFHVTTVGIGVEDQYALMLKEFAKEHSIEQYVSILGEVDGITELASSMDVGIMPSRNEAFGRVTVEYMLQNLAVIANDSGANTEIIEDGKSGLIYPHDNFLALADNMRKLIENRVLLVSLAENGRQKANACFLSSYNTKSIYKLYQEISLHRVFEPHSFSNFICNCIILFYGIYAHLCFRYRVLRSRRNIS